MQALPHIYRVEAFSDGEEAVAVASSGLETIGTAPPSEYGGPGDRWSPETLLVAAVADCFALSFRAIARASSLPWSDLRCECEGKVDRVEGATRFVDVQIRALLTVPARTDAAKAQRLLEKAERTCLITNSLKCSVGLQAEVTQGEATPRRATVSG